MSKIFNKLKISKLIAQEKIFLLNWKLLVISTPVQKYQSENPICKLISVVLDKVKYCNKIMKKTL